MDMKNVHQIVEQMYNKVKRLTVEIQDGWPNKHIDVLKNIGLIGSLHSPFVLVNRKLSLSKWSKKIERVINSFIKKIDTDNLINSIIYKDDNKIDQIKNIFKYPNLVFLQGGPGTGKTTLIIKLILELLQIDNFLNIGLSAPTGKATCLLYTSPSPRDGLLSRMPSSA